MTVVTLADVARRAGVATSTVSYVISRKRPISPETRDRVMRAVKELGYHPNAGARALASRRSATIALMVPLRSDMYVPVLMEIVTAVATAAREHGHDTLLLTGNEGAAGLRRIAASGSADAVILMDIELEDDRVPVLAETGMPSVLLGLPANAAGLTCVDLDFAATGAACAHHLADLGHRHVALIGESSDVYRRRTGFAARTLDGFLRAARGRGLHAVHHPCEADFDSVAATLGPLLDERPAITGLVVQNEAVLPALLRQLARRGRCVPEDISIVAICPEQLAVQSSPTLTSVSIPAQEMGRAAVELAVANLEGEVTEGTMLIPPRLAVRGSTARR